MAQKEDDGIMTSGPVGNNGNGMRELGQRAFAVDGHSTLLGAVEAWFLDNNREQIRELLPHAMAFKGSPRLLLEGLAVLFHGGASLGPVEAIEKLEKAGKREEAKALEAMLEAVPERQSSKGRREKTAARG